jgi:hypothetical protein
MIDLAPFPFELWAAREGYNTAPAVSSPTSAPMRTVTLRLRYEAWIAGAAHVARMVTESTLETEALRDKIQALACK